SVCVAFFLNNSAYYGEIYRAGLESVGAGQREAARSTGLTAWQAMVYVVIPQAVRNVLPDLVSNTVEVVKLTSLASVVALPDMLYSADMSRSLTYNSSPGVFGGIGSLGFARAGGAAKTRRQPRARRVAGRPAWSHRVRRSAAPMVNSAKCGKSLARARDLSRITLRFIRATKMNEVRR